MRTKRGLIAAFAALALVVPAQASASTISASRIPTPPRVLVLHEPCPEDGGSCTDQVTETVYLHSADPFNREHELGHLSDSEQFSDAERAAITPLLGGVAGDPWDGPTGEDCFGHVCPNERLADAFAACRLDLHPSGLRRHGHLLSDWQTAYGYNPTRGQHQRVCAAIRRYAA